MDGRLWVVLSLLALLCAHAEANGILVNTPLGRVLGEQADGLFKFRSIPYAVPPVGSLRWTAPQPALPWSPRVYNATSYVAACPQAAGDVSSPPYLTVPLSEDCLQLNVFTPSVQASAELPVMVFIHGGSFIAGWGGDPTFYGDYLVNRSSDTVVVTINYRLGALGYLVSPQTPKGNFGLLDQQLALSWVQKNIAAFGGDPKRVTLFGQSAGAMSTLLHMLSPSSSGLFQRAILESNPIGLNYRTSQQALVQGAQLAKFLDCAADDIDCMKGASWEEIVNTQQRCLDFALPLNSTMLLPFYPVIDGDLIPNQPMEMIKSGQFNQDLQLAAFGTTRNDSMEFVPSPPIDYDEYRAIVRAYFANNASKVLKQYPPVRGQDNHNLVRSSHTGGDSHSHCSQLSIAATDWLFDCPNRLAALSFGESVPKASNGESRSRLYHFLHVPTDPVDPKNHPLCNDCSCHSAELTFVFHSESFVGEIFTKAENRFSLDLQQYWINIARGIDTAPFIGLPIWPTYDRESNSSISFSIPITTTSNYNSQKVSISFSLP
jgi:carboxylesterase type B